MSIDTPKPIPSEPGWYWALVAGAPQHWHWTAMLVDDSRVITAGVDDDPRRVVAWQRLYHPGYPAKPGSAEVPA